MRFTLVAILISLAGCGGIQQQSSPRSMNRDDTANTMITKFVESEIPVNGTSGISPEMQPVASDQLDISERLKRLQAFFDQQDAELLIDDSDTAIIQRLMFAGRVVEVRQLHQDDTVVGTLDGKDSVVAELVITHTVDNRHSAIRPAGKIVIPANRSAETLRLMQERGDEYVFEYTKLGSREIVGKFGC